MQTFENTVTIQRPTKEVFAFLADFENIPKWNYAIEDTSKTSAGPVAVGTRYRQTRSVPSRNVESFEVTVFEPASRLAIHGQIGPFQATISYELEARAGATRLVNNVELDPSQAMLGLAAPLATPRIKAAVAQNLGELRLILEGSRTGRLAGGRTPRARSMLRTRAASRSAPAVQADDHRLRVRAPARLQQDAGEGGGVGVLRGLLAGSGPLASGSSSCTPVWTASAALPSATRAMSQAPSHWLDGGSCAWQSRVADRRAWASPAGSPVCRATRPRMYRQTWLM